MTGEQVKHGATSAEGTVVASTGGMRAWIDVMRHLEPIMADYERIFDAWASGGVDGLVMGP
ncbi:MAG: hypothetical protein EBV53_12085, partial [Proteobacteria bacterium]|nr:hypothetical protein [Pseudomonadota bacterium]